MYLKLHVQGSKKLVISFNLQRSTKYSMDTAKITQNITTELEQLKKYTSTPEKGITRFPFTQEAKEAANYLAQLMTEVGLKVRTDNTGSIIGRLEGKSSETIMLGSHYDSVKHGGAYDGIAGVICAIEVARLLRENNNTLSYSLEIIATNDEEGARFNTGLFTGKVLLGQLTVDDIKNQFDAQGISVYDAMKSYGLQPDEIAEHTRNDIKAFLEIHIEQGPVLEYHGAQLGIVQVIVGIKRAKIAIHGRADHAGTMPMNMRQDALEQASKVISKISDRARLFPNSVATVGYLEVKPNIMNIVPSEVNFAVEIRGTDEDSIMSQYYALLADLDQMSHASGLTYTAENLLFTSPVKMNETIMNILEASCIERGYSYMQLPSGAGHDAQIFGEQIPAAMLFVPSIGGRSHCPEEKSDPKDLAVATIVAYDAILKIANSL